MDNGVVEALLDGSSAGSAPVKAGRADLSVSLDNRAEGTVVLTVRYLPASPWHLPGPPMQLQVPVAPPSPLWRALLLIVVLLAASWVIFSWRRERTLPTKSRSQPLLAPGVHVIASRRGGTHYSGTVLDAHDGSAVAGAQVSVRAPSLDGPGIILDTVSDDDGTFAFELGERPDAAEIVAEAPLHSQQRRALPAAGELRIALVTRRRAVVQRLVQWARVRGKPYDHQPDPTPAHVRRNAAGREPVEVWARGVEQAAFGAAPVDAGVERHLHDVEPGPEQA